MKKKLKAFTLVELIVAIAVFGILMTGIVKMIEPMSNAATNASVLNNQRNVENAIVTYIGENLRYASNLAIIEGGTADEAVNKFISLGPCDTKGYQIDYTSAINGPANKAKIKVLAFDTTNTYPYKNHDFTGRLISKVDGKSGSLDFSYASLNSSGSTNQYLVFGDDYYAQGDYFLKACISDGSLYLSVDSDYFYTPTKNKLSNSSSTPTRGTYELRTLNGKKSATAPLPFVFACLKSTETANTDNIAAVGRADSKTIYFVYTYPTDNLVNNGSVGVGTPGGDANCSLTTF